MSETGGFGGQATTEREEPSDNNGTEPSPSALEESVTITTSEEAVPSTDEPSPLELTELTPRFTNFSGAEADELKIKLN